MVLFSDNALSNSATRKSNIEALEKSGFKEGGLKSRSGELELVEKATKCQLVFGIRSNINGKKYFSMSKDYATKEAAKEAAKVLELVKK